MIEVYIDNHDLPSQVEETVNKMGIQVIKFEHADSVSCIYLHGAIGIEPLYALDIMHVRKAGEK